jgi:hypothetical protein
VQGPAVDVGRRGANGLRGRGQGVAVLDCLDLLLLEPGDQRVDLFGRDRDVAILTHVDMGDANVAISPT